MEYNCIILINNLTVLFSFGSVSGPPLLDDLFLSILYGDGDHPLVQC